MEKLRKIGQFIIDSLVVITLSIMFGGLFGGIIGLLIKGNVYLFNLIF